MGSRGGGLLDCNLVFIFPLHAARRAMVVVGGSLNGG